MQPTLSFRRDIEGLRAVAVLLVVAAHAGVPWLQGGYVGVDVFFVISGFLITGLLLGEVDRTGRIDLAAFYGRRLLRLFPALILVTVVTCIMAAVLLAPFEQPTQARGALGAITWTSNFFFAFEDVGYFDPGSQYNLFLHTWSLGVEEQFYLLWPLLLILAMTGTTADVSARRKRLVTAILGVGLLSVAACLWLTGHDQKLAFYMVFSRAWQFALGAVVFLSAPVLFGSGKAASGLVRVSPGLAALVGVALIVVPSLAYGHDAPYPGWRALPPSLGAALLLASGSASASASARNPIGALLSTPAMVSIGGVSYALYLWHWPVFVLGRAVLPDPEWQPLALLAIVSIVLAYLTRRFVEQPMRRARQLLPRPRVVIAGALGIAACGIAAASAWSGKAKGWEQQPLQVAIDGVRRDGSPLYAYRCDDWFHSDRLKVCAFGPANAGKTVVLIGDSVGAQWFTAVRKHFPSPDWQVLVMFKSACPMVDQSFFYQRIGRRFVECDVWRERVLTEITRLRPDAVVMGSSGNYPFSPQQWREGSKRVLSRVVASGASTHLLAPLPALPFDPATCAARDAWRQRVGFRGICVSRNADVESDAVRQALAHSASAAGAGFVDFTDAICPAGWCRPVRNGRIMYRDPRHLTESYVRALAPEFSRRLSTDGAKRVE